jgi:dipeptidyl aminopeptidase/acylaminoacyl peptidase
MQRRDVAGVVATIAAMPSQLKFKWIAAFAAAAALFALPAAAQATLTYVKNPFHPVVFAANDNGGAAFKVGKGTNPRVSPDGDVIAYARESSGGKRQLMLAAAAGGGSKAVLTNLQESFYVTFSPDSKLVAAIRGPELGKRRLVLIDVTSGTLLRTVATGYFSGVSFSPDGTELAYSVANSEKFPPHSDVFTATIAPGKPVQITKGGNSLDPLWGPTGKIVFVKQLGAKSRKYGPKNELFLMSQFGTQVKRLTHTKVGALLQGLYPTAWSASGNQLLAEFEGQDTSYAVTVNSKTGAQKPLDKMGDGERGFVGTALSADGTTVLGFTGGFEPGPNHDVATIPYGGGKSKTLVKNAFEPDWSR